MQFYTCVDITPAIQYNQFWYGQLLVLELDTTSHNVLLSLFLEYGRHHITHYPTTTGESLPSHVMRSMCVHSEDMHYTMVGATRHFHCVNCTLWGCRVEGGNTGPIPRSSVSFPDHQSHSQITSLIPRSLVSFPDHAGSVGSHDYICTLTLAGTSPFLFDVGKLPHAK